MLVQEILTEVMFTDRNEVLRNRTKQTRFYRSSLPTTSTITPHRISKRFSQNTARDIIQQQAKLKNIFHQSTIVSNRKEKSLKGIPSPRENSFNLATITKSTKQLKGRTWQSTYNHLKWLLKTAISIHSFIAKQPGQYIFRSHNWSSLLRT